jgi:hypothetical protein
MESHTFTSATTVVVAENALSTTIDGETMILDQDAGVYYGLNEVGTFIWDLLQEPRSVGELCRKVATEYDVEQERCRADVEDLIEDLTENDLVRLDVS